MALHAGVQVPDLPRHADVETFIVETVDPEGPYGAKEAGQGPLLPVPPAVCSAVYDALGVWIDEVPVTPEKIVEALRRKAKGEPARYGPAPLSRHPVPDDDQGRSATEGAGPCCGCLDLSTCVRRPRARRRAWPPSSGRARCSWRGGTDLFPKLKRRQFDIDALIGLDFLPREIRNGSTDCVVGAGVTLAAATGDAHLNERFSGYAEAAGLVSSPPLRNVGTVGGNLCVDTRCNYYDMTYEWRKAAGFCLKKDGDICLVAPSSPRCWAVSSSDTAPMAIALDGVVTLAGPDGERELPVSALYRDDGIDYMAKQPSEVVTSLTLSADPQDEHGLREAPAPRARSTFRSPARRSPSSWTATRSSAAASCSPRWPPTRSRRLPLKNS